MAPPGGGGGAGTAQPVSPTSSDLTTVVAAGDQGRAPGKPGLGCPRPQGRGRATQSLVLGKMTRITGRGRGARGGRRAADETGTDPSRARHPLRQQV